MEGQIDSEHSLPQAVVEWLDKAVSAYYEDRILKIFDQIGKEDDTRLRAQWNDLMTDMHGHDQAKNQQFMNILMTDPRVSEKARQLLKG